MTMTSSQHGSCCHQTAVPSVTQTLDEMEWDRGIWSSAFSGDVLRIEKLIASGCDVDAIDKSGYTALHYSSRNGHTNIVALLLRHGANPNIQTRSGAATPLHRAVYVGHHDIISLLLGARANVLLRDGDGKTVLHKAVERGHTNICSILIDANPALVHVKDNKGLVAKDYANPNDEKLQALLSPA